MPADVIKNTENCRCSSGLQHHMEVSAPENEVSVLPRNVGIFLQVHMTLQPRVTTLKSLQPNESQTQLIFMKEGIFIHPSITDNS